MMYKFNYKAFAVGIILLFILAAMIPCISSYSYNVVEFYSSEEMTKFNPFKEGWNYCKKVTIYHNKVNGDLFNFPVLINIIDSNLQIKAQNDGDDILFMDGKGEANQLFHELEMFDCSSGRLIAWVNIPIIYSDEDTFFYMYYGNLNCASQEFDEKVWDSNFKAVYHMNYDSGGLIDSTFNDYNCNQILGSPNYNQNGKIGYSIYFDRDNNEAFEGDDYFDGLEEMTVEAWIYLDEYPLPYSSHCMILTHETVWYFGINWEFKKVVFDFHGDGVETIDNIYCPLETWYYLVGTWSDTDDLIQLYGNGELKDSCIYTDEMGDYNDHFSVGYKQHHSDFFDGMIDEIRVSNIQRDFNWINTTYLNHNNPQDFISFGREEKIFRTVTFLKFMDISLFLQKIINKLIF